MSGSQTLEKAAQFPGQLDPRQRTCAATDGTGNVGQKETQPSRARLARRRLEANEATSYSVSGPLDDAEDMKFVAAWRVKP